jgi:hypothetical protein
MCNDNNACTEDSCDPSVGCINVEKICDDNDDSTYDYCDPAAGCLNRPQSEGCLESEGGTELGDL